MWSKGLLTALLIDKLCDRCSSGHNYTFTTPLNGKKNLLNFIGLEPWIMQPAFHSGYKLRYPVTSANF